MTDLPRRDELVGQLAELFVGSGWVVEDAWMEWWEHARIIRLMARPKEPLASPVIRDRRAWQLRKRMIEQTGLTWVVVIYDRRLTAREQREVIASMAEQFG